MEHNLLQTVETNALTDGKGTGSMVRLRNERKGAEEQMSAAALVGSPTACCSGC